MEGLLLWGGWKKRERGDTHIKPNDKRNATKGCMGGLRALVTEYAFFVSVWLVEIQLSSVPVWYLALNGRVIVYVEQVWEGLQQI